MTNCRHKEGPIGYALKGMILITLVLALIVSFASAEIFAESSVTLSCDDKVKGGDTFTVEVKFDGGIGRVDAGLTYDTDSLTYISGGSSSGNSGYVQLAQAGTDGSVTFKLKFQAVSDGNAELSLETYELYDLNESYIAEQPSASKTIKISGDADSDELIKEESSEKPVEDTDKEGVDEKSFISEHLTAILIACAVLVVAIIVVVVIIIRKKKNGDKNNNDKNYHSKH